MDANRGSTCSGCCYFNVVFIPLLVSVSRTVVSTEPFVWTYGSWDLQPNFTDEVDDAMPVETLRSSLHLVRSWFSKMFAGHTRQSLTGLLGVCSTSDMQVSRLADEARSRPWDQLVKSSLSEALLLGNAALSNELATTSTVPIDDYRSSVLAQLDSVEVLSPPRAGRRSSPVAMVSAKSKKSARRQSDVAWGIGVSTSAPLVSKSKKSAAKSVRSARCDMSSASRGQTETLK